MNRIIAAILAAAALTLAPATSRAASKDFCLELTDTPPDTFVARNFKLPKTGTCKPFTGFFNDADAPVTGTACAATDGTRYSFTLTSADPDLGGPAIIDAVILDSSTLAGADTQIIVNSSSQPNTVNVLGTTCGGIAVPSTLPGSPRGTAARSKP
jgi:hypothetical protein